MNKYEKVFPIVLAIVISLGVGGCSSKDEPEPCGPPDGGCPNGTEWNQEQCACVAVEPPCEKPPKPGEDCTWNKKQCKWKCPAIPGPGMEVYLTLEEGDELLNFRNSKNPGLHAETQDLEVNGRIAAVHVLGKCPWSLADGRYPFFPLTAKEMAGYTVEIGKLVKQSRQSFQKRLVEPNRRCDKDHQEYHPSYCEVSDVQKDVWEPWYAGFKGWLEYARTLEDEVAHCRKFLNENYDNIRGWCGAMNRVNKRSCP